MTSQAASAKVAETLSHKWHKEHRALDVFIEGFRQWAYQVSQRGLPRFGETAARLQQLHQRLEEHFACEDDLASQFATSRIGLSPEVDANRRQVAQDHNSLLSRLQRLIEKLNETDPPFASWQAATDQVDRLLDALDQHEEQEADSITWLLPKKGEATDT